MAHRSTLNPFRWNHDLYREALKEADVTPAQIRCALGAAGVFWTLTRINSLLAGEISPHLSTAAALADAVGRPVDDFIVKQDAA